MTQPKEYQTNNQPTALDNPQLTPQKPINFMNIEGFIEVIDTVPAFTPKKLRDCIKIYINGATYRIYFYDYKNAVWHYAGLT